MSVDYDEKERRKLEQIIAPILTNPEDHHVWDRVISDLTEVEGNITRNSSNMVITKIREVYDRLLTRFPLYFGYWKKYADLEFSISGPEQAELIYERGIASLPVSCDLWAFYCDFKSQTCHDQDVVRDLFERALGACGLDWRSEPLWDKYIEFEDRMDQPQRKWAILLRVSTIGTGKWHAFYEKFCLVTWSRPLEEVVSADILQHLTVTTQTNWPNLSRAEEERKIRELVNQHYQKVCRQGYDDFAARYPFEEKIKISYFTNTDLPEAELENWRRYLDFEEQCRRYDRIRHLYERCITVCANYEEFWLRYVGWTMSNKQLGLYKDHGNAVHFDPNSTTQSHLLAAVSPVHLDAYTREEHARHIFARASCIFLPIAKTNIRFLWATFEEACSSGPDAAAEIYRGILAVTPYDLIAAERLMYLDKRHQGIDKAVENAWSLLSTNPDIEHRAKWMTKIAGMLLSFGREQEGRNVFETHANTYEACVPFWKGYLNYEMKAAVPRVQSEADPTSVVRGVSTRIRQNLRLSPTVRKQLTKCYMDWLLENGPQGCAVEYMLLHAADNCVTEDDNKSSPAAPETSGTAAGPNAGG